MTTSRPTKRKVLWGGSIAFTLLFGLLSVPYAARNLSQSQEQWAIGAAWEAWLVQAFIGLAVAVLFLPIAMTLGAVDDTTSETNSQIESIRSSLESIADQVTSLQQEITDMAPEEAAPQDQRIQVAVDITVPPDQDSDDLPGEYQVDFPETTD